MWAIRTTDLEYIGWCFVYFFGIILVVFMVREWDSVVGLLGSRFELHVHFDCLMLFVGHSKHCDPCCFDRPLCLLLELCTFIMHSLIVTPIQEERIFDQHKISSTI